MILRWEQGRAEVDELLRTRVLERVSADRNLAELYLAEAKRHLASSKLTLDSDPTGGFQLTYDAARKAWVALLITQGLRPISRSGHAVIEQALRAQLTPPRNNLIDSFGWMRQLRNASEYPSFEKPTATTEDAVRAQSATEEIIEKTLELLDLMPVY